MDCPVIEQRLTVLTHQRVAAGTGGPRAQHIAAHSFVPGSVLRGALASVWITDHGGRGEGFVELFEGPLRYSPALPAGSAVEPASRRWEKYPPKEGTNRRWFDDATKRCEHGDGCGGCADSSAGWRQEHNGLRAGAVGLRRVITSTAIDRVNGSGAHGHLFSHTVLERNTVLCGAVRGPAHAIEALRGLLSDRLTVVLGGRGSVLGESVVLLDGPARPYPDPRIVPGTVRIILPGPTILVDDTGAPSTDLAGAVATAVGVDRERVTAWSRPSVQPWAGWHAASDTRKPTDLALEGGAVAVITGLTTQETAACERLAAAGLGMRRAEGFGWVEILDAQDDVLTVDLHRADDGEASEDSSRYRASEPPLPSFADLLTELRRAGLDRQQCEWLVTRLRKGTAPDVQTSLKEETPSRLPTAARCTVEKVLRIVQQSGRMGNALAAVLEDHHPTGGPRRGSEHSQAPARGGSGQTDRGSRPSPAGSRSREVYPFAGNPFPVATAVHPPATTSLPAPEPVDPDVARTRIGGVRTYLRVEIELLSAFHVGRSAGGQEDIGTGAIRPVLTTRARDGVEEHCVPASQVRGSIRAHLAASDPSTAARLFGPAVEDTTADAGLHASCWRVLGTRLSGILVLEKRTQTVIDRTRRAPTAGRLRSTQVVVPITDPATGSPPLLVVYLASDIADADVIDPLVQALSTWDPHIGAARGSGLGRCRVRAIRRLTLAATDPAHLLHRLRHSNGPDALDLLLETHGQPQPVRGPADTCVLETAFTLPHGWQPHRSVDASRPDRVDRPGELPLTMAGSRWRGMLRSRVEFIGRSLGLSVCDSSDQACGECDVCAAFGSQHAAGALDVEDLPVRQPDNGPDARRRTRVSINRFTGGAANDRLFTESARHGDCLLLRVHARREVPGWVVRACLHTVRDLAEGLAGVGLASGTGLGTVHTTSMRVRGTWARAAGLDGDTDLPVEKVAAIAVLTDPKPCSSMTDSPGRCPGSPLDRDQENDRP